MARTRAPFRTDAAPDALPVVGMIEIGMRAGVKRNTVSSWIDRYPEFPAPVADLAIGPIFWWPSVAAWLTATGRQTDAGWTREQVTHQYGKGAVPHRVRRWAAKYDDK